MSLNCRKLTNICQMERPNAMSSGPTFQSKLNLPLYSEILRMLFNACSHFTRNDHYAPFKAVLVPKLEFPNIWPIFFHWWCIEPLFFSFAREYYIDAKKSINLTYSTRKSRHREKNGKEVNRKRYRGGMAEQSVTKKKCVSRRARKSKNRCTHEQLLINLSLNVYLTWY